jgi:hypothetical protein
MRQTLIERALADGRASVSNSANIDRGTPTPTTRHMVEDFIEDLHIQVDPEVILTALVCNHSLSKKPN